MRTDVRKRCTCGPRCGPRCAKVTSKSPKWIQNGSPGPSQKWSCTRTALKTAQYAIRTLFTMVSSRQHLRQHIIFDSFLLAPFIKNRFPHPCRQKLFRSEVLGGVMVPHGLHMVPWIAQGASKIASKFSETEILGPGYPRRSPKARPGSKKSSQFEENRSKITLLDFPNLRF